MKKVKKYLQSNILYIAWVQSLVAMLGSLYFSEVMKLPPCVLCWYQRILMYPLVALIAVGIIRRDKGIYQYILPLSITGFLIAAYHNLLYYGIIPESIQPCRLGISCTTRQIEWFGFITIPLMSLTAFAIITTCMFIYRKVVTK
jgi:disulfide bond formation protein DsbB